MRGEKMSPNGHQNGSNRDRAAASSEKPHRGKTANGQSGASSYAMTLEANAFSAKAAEV
jgi:hypothetical protein